MLEVLNDDAWDIWRVSQVTSGLNGAQRALVRLCQGAYQVPRALLFDRAFVRDQLAASFITATSAFLFSGGNRAPMAAARVGIAEWGQRLPDYVAPASAAKSRSRVTDSFEWAMITDGGLVITTEDWEVTKGLSSRPTIEGMSVSDLIDRGFHLDLRECFPPAPSMLRPALLYPPAPNSS